MDVLLVCGSPRKGNSESVIKKFEFILKEKGAKTELVLLREKNILPCEGCVEFCNKEFLCKHEDDTKELLERFESAERYVIVAPTYFSMPPGVLKNFIDKCAILWNKKRRGKVNFSKRKGVVMTIGAHIPSVRKNAECIAEFYRILGISCIKVLTLRGVSKIPESDYILRGEENPNIINELENIANEILR